MVFKGGMYFLDLSGVDLEGAGETIPGIYASLKRIKGKPVYLYLSMGTAKVEGLASIIFVETGEISIQLSAYDGVTDKLMVVEILVTDDDGVSPGVVTFSADT